MAHTKAAGSAKRTVDVAGKRLGVKKFAGEFVKPGNIIIRQHGTKFHAGVGTMLGRDYSVFAVVEGFVSFRRMSGYKRNQNFVDVLATRATIAPNTRKTSGTKQIDARMLKSASAAVQAKTAAQAEVVATKEKPKAAKVAKPAKKPATKKAAK